MNNIEAISPYRAMKQALEFIEANTYGGSDVDVLAMNLRAAIEQAAVTESHKKLEPVVVPSFIRQRLEREIKAATNPKGMSVHDGRTRALAADIAYLLKAIDLYTTPPAAPYVATPRVQEPFDHTQAACDALRSAMNRSNDIAKATIGQRKHNAYDDYRETMKSAFDSPPEQDIPAAWFDPEVTYRDAGLSWTPGQFHTEPLYKAPAAQRQSARSAWVGLTDEDQEAIYAEAEVLMRKDSNLSWRNAICLCADAKLRAVNGFSCDATEKNGY